MSYSSELNARPGVKIGADDIIMRVARGTQRRLHVEHVVDAPKEGEVIGDTELRTEIDNVTTGFQPPVVSKWTSPVSEVNVSRPCPVSCDPDSFKLTMTWEASP